MLGADLGDFGNALALRDWKRREGYPFVRQHLIDCGLSDGVQHDCVVGRQDRTNDGMGT